MRLKIIPEDSFFTIDGVSKKGFTFNIDPEIHAVTWEETSGEIEYKEKLVDGVLQKKDNLSIFDIGQFAQQISEWNVYVEPKDDSLPFGYNRQIYDTIPNIEWTYEIVDMMVAQEYDDKQNIVDKVDFNLQGKLRNTVVKQLFSWKFSKYNEQKQFVNFEDLTESIVIDWLQSDIPENEMLGIKYTIAENINSMNYPEVVRAELPWKNPVIEEVINVDSSNTSSNISDTPTSNT